MLIPKTNKFVEEYYNIEEEAATASLFTTGNGYIGVRGSFEEYGSLRIQGAYIRGIIDEVIDVVEPFADNEYMKKYYFDEEQLKTFEYTESIINNVGIFISIAESISSLISFAVWWSSSPDKYAVTTSPFVSIFTDIFNLLKQKNKPLYHNRGLSLKNLSYFGAN